MAKSDTARCGPPWTVSWSWRSPTSPSRSTEASATGSFGTPPGEMLTWSTRPSMGRGCYRTRGSAHEDVGEMDHGSGARLGDVEGDEHADLLGPVERPAGVGIVERRPTRDGRSQLEADHPRREQEAVLDCIRDLELRLLQDAVDEDRGPELDFVVADRSDGHVDGRDPKCSSSRPGRRRDRARAALRSLARARHVPVA